MSQNRLPEEKTLNSSDIEKIHNKLIDYFKYITDTEKAKQLASILIKKIEKLLSPSLEQGETHNILNAVIKSVDDLMLDFTLSALLSKQDEFSLLLHIALSIPRLNPVDNHEFKEETIINKTNLFFKEVKNLQSLHSISAEFKFDLLQKLLNAYFSSTNALLNGMLYISELLTAIFNAKFYLNLAREIGEHINQIPIAHEEIHSTFYDLNDEGDKPVDFAEKSELLCILNDKKPTPAISQLNEEILAAFKDEDEVELTTLSEHLTSPIPSLTQSSTLFYQSPNKSPPTADQESELVVLRQ